MKMKRLAPNSGVQFIDFAFNAASAGTCRFGFEKPDDDRLSPLQADEDGESFRNASGVLVPEELQVVGGLKQALALFADSWLPVPYFRSQERGPVNWARVYLPASLRGGDAKAVFAFDTTLAEHAREIRNPQDLALFAAKTPVSRDVTDSAKVFSLPEDRRLLEDYAALPWVREWVRRLARAEEGADLERRMARQRKAMANYLALLYAFAAPGTTRAPGCSFLDTVTRVAGREPIQVDLILDIGNSRSFGLLIETRDEAGPVDLTNSYPLELRDVSRPDLTHNRPFPSRVEFCKPDFGPSDLSRLAGPPGAFLWPSAARIGEEAVWLSHENAGVEGATGMTSPKRYLWSMEPVGVPWRLNPGRAHAARGGDLCAQADNFTREGEYIPRLRRKGEERTPAMTANFSRSSLMTFFLIELLLQTLREINCPGRREKQGHPEEARRLHRIILTMPTAMTRPERKILETRAQDAVDEVWEKMRLDPAQKPVLLMQWDEATATQAVFVYNEVTERFFGDLGAFMHASARKIDGERRLRIASLDIGGGTSDLIVSSYADEQGSLRPRQEFREGFQCAGDDIVKAVIEHHVLPALQAHLTAKGVQGVREHMAACFGASRSDDGALRRIRRQQFTQQVLTPLALWLLERHEADDRFGGAVEHRAQWSEVFANRRPPTPEALDFFRKIDGFSGEVSLEDLSFSVSGEKLSARVAKVMEEFLNSLSEAAYHYDCDFLLLAGRPSRFPAVRDLIMRRMPVSPDRVIPMHGYEVGAWYPFRTSEDQIGDPKTCAAVGAMICALSEGWLHDFHMKTRHLTMRSTARFIGRIHQSKIRDEHLLFREVDMEDDRQAMADVSFRLNPPAALGFRQMDLERWPATMLYALSLRQSEAAARSDEDVDVTLTRLDPAEDPAEKLFEASRASSGGEEIPRSRLRMSLQTMLTSEAHWEDSGSFDLGGIR